MTEWELSSSISSIVNSTELPPVSPIRVLSPTARIIIIITYVVGVIGNLAALHILNKERKTRYRNKKHTLMLTCLVGNDLMGIVGMLVQLVLHPFIPYGHDRIGCGFRVVWRGFGVSSGCVSLVMAVERWLALTQPFQYHKRVTYNSLLKAIIICWATVLVLSCMPFFGFGLYYDPLLGRCKRYRDAVELADVAYAYLFFAFGLLLSLSIVAANLGVTRYLGHAGSSPAVGRRICRSTQQKLRVQCLSTASPDEVAFARLMIALSVTFLLCWLPNLIAIPLAQWHTINPRIRFFKSKFFVGADILMAIHFTLDPYVYVLLHHYFPCPRITFNLLQRFCCCRAKETHTEENSSCI